MKQTDFRDVPDELWERIDLFLPRSNEKEVAAASRFHSARFLPEFSTNAGADANGPCFPPVTVQKALSMSTSNAGAKPGVMAEIFRIFLAEYGEKVGVDAQWQAMDGTLLQAPTRSQKISG